MAKNEGTQTAWCEVPNGWRQLYGDFDRLGLSVEWHEFRTEEALDWGRSFRPRSVEFCLNMEGRGAVGPQKRRARGLHFRHERLLLARRRASACHA